MKTLVTCIESISDLCSVTEISSILTDTLLILNILLSATISETEHSQTYRKPEFELIFALLCYI